MELTAEIDVVAAPYVAAFRLRGTADLLVVRWNDDGKKGDDVHRNEYGGICIPGEYVRSAIVEAGKFRQDPRYQRKSARDLLNHGITCLDELSSLGVTDVDYIDVRFIALPGPRVEKRRPAMYAGWEADFRMKITSPEYIGPDLFKDMLTLAGTKIGLGHFRPTYGRFDVVSFEVAEG